MQGLLAVLDAAGTPRVKIYGGPRPAAGSVPVGPLIAQVILAEPSGAIVDGDLILGTGVQSIVLANATPSWARFVDGADAFLFDVDARLSSAADAGQELVVQASSLLPGGLLNIISGTFSAKP